MATSKFKRTAVVSALLAGMSLSAAPAQATRPTAPVDPHARPAMRVQVFTAAVTEEGIRPARARGEVARALAGDRLVLQYRQGTEGVWTPVRKELVQEPVGPQGVQASVVKHRAALGYWRLKVIRVVAGPAGEGTTTHRWFTAPKRLVGVR